MTTKAPILRVDLSSVVPVYEQLANGIRVELVTGGLKLGDQLPTVRDLGLRLGVHHNTVAEAYRRLAREGWLDLRRGRGATVIERTHPAPSEKTQAEFSQRLRELATKAVAHGVPKRAIAAEMIAVTAELEKGKSK